MWTPHTVQRTEMNQIHTLNASHSQMPYKRSTNGKHAFERSGTVVSRVKTSDALNDDGDPPRSS